MYRSLTEQMQSFSLAIQQAMIKNVQSTLVKQLEIFQAMQKPFVSQGLKLGSSMQHIMLEQIRMLNTGLQTPMAEQLNEFSSSVQRIMAEQLQIFAASTPSPTPAQMQEFIEGVQAVVAEQMKFTNEMQKLLSEQMQQFTENLQSSLADLVGKSV